MGMGGGSAGREARRAREEEEARELRVKEGTQKVRQQFSDTFNQDYYNTKISDPLKAYYKGDLNKQYDVARRQLQSALLRSGMFDSTFGSQKMTDADTAKTERERDIDEMALDAVAKRKQEVLENEGAVLAQLTSTADTGLATSQAAQRISSISPRPGFSPLGAVFQDLTAGLATQADLERQGTNRYNMGVSNWGNNLARYMRNIGGGRS